MYLKGSNWSMNRRRRPLRIGRILVLLLLVSGAVYVDRVIVPSSPPLFIPTPTSTRAPESYIAEAQRLENEGKYSQAISTYTIRPFNPIQKIRQHIFRWLD
jgi:hypothetical protein